jgi:hypothetical protein
MTVQGSCCGSVVRGPCLEPDVRQRRADEFAIGDRHLRALLLVDAAVMSGGAGFAADVMSVLADVR